MDGPTSPSGSLFGPINRLKETDVREEMAAHKEIEKLKYKDSLVGAVAKSDYFERLTLVVITLNALSIGVDADYTARIGKDENLYKTPTYFIIVELFFTAYFSAEVVIRFVAYREKCKVFCDWWFMFDSVLVSLMLIEVLVVPFLGSNSPLGQLSVLRLLRLLRITRVAKLLRMFPELMLIVTSIQAAIKAVCWTALLLVLITFTWAILFTNEYHQGNMSDDEARALGGAEHLFGSIPKCMINLLIMGTITDEVTYATDTIRASGNHLMLLAFIVYILLNSFTMMNMLIGILVKVVSSTAETEKGRMTGEQALETIKAIFNKIDDDGSGCISRDEFRLMRKNPMVQKALGRMGIQSKQFEMYVELIFFETEEISFDALCKMLMMLRPGTHVSALDFATLKQLVYIGQANMIRRVSKLENALSTGSFSREGSFGHEDSVASRFTRQADKDPMQPISMNMFAEVERSSRADIVAEIQRRMGMSNLDETGVPLSMLDEDLQRLVREADDSLVSPDALKP